MSRKKGAGGRPARRSSPAESRQIPILPQVPVFLRDLHGPAEEVQPVSLLTRDRIAVIVPECRRSHDPGGKSERP